MPLIKRKIQDEVYKHTIYLYRGSENELKKIFPDWCEDSFGRFCWYEKGPTFNLYIGILKYSTKEKQRACLAHECLHLTFYVMRHVGVPLTSDSEEAFTYFFDSVYGKALKALGL